MRSRSVTIWAMAFVLGLASWANADLIFTVNGEPQPEDITLEPSDTIELGLDVPDGHSVSGFSLGYSLTNAQAEFFAEDIELPGIPPFEIAIYPPPWGEPQYVRISWYTFITPPLVGPVVLMRGLEVRCLEPTDVVLDIVVEDTTIIDGETIPNGTVLHTLIIHQIPEPMTLLLVGFGGLALLRKRRCGKTYSK